MRIHGGLPRNVFAFAINTARDTDISACTVLGRALFKIACLHNIWKLGTMGAIPVFISIICWVYSPHFVDNETAYRLSTDTSVYKNGDQNWLALWNGDP